MLDASVASYDVATRTIVVTVPQLNPKSVLTVQASTRLTDAALGQMVVNKAVIGAREDLPRHPKDPEHTLSGDPIQTALETEARVIPPTLTKAAHELESTIADKRLLEYTVTVSNSNPADTAWKDLLVYDTLPSELAYVQGTLSITFDGNQTQALDDSCYHKDNHTIQVPIAVLEGGKSCVVRYRCYLNATTTTAVVNNVELLGVDDEGIGTPKASFSIDPNDSVVSGQSDDTEDEAYARDAAGDLAVPRLERTDLAVTGDQTPQLAAIVGLGIIVGSAGLVLRRRRKG